MKTLLLNLFVAFLSILSVGRSASCQCATGLEDHEWVLIPVVFEFESEQTRALKLYNSLYPRLLIPRTSETYLPTSSTVDDRQLHVGFCVPAEDVNSLHSEFQVSFGPRSFKIVARPISWRSEVMFSRQIKQGTMSSIYLLKQPNPDWLVIRSASWLENAKRVPRIEVSLRNFSSNPHAGVQLGLWSALGEGCITGPTGRVRTAEVEISLVVNRGKIRLASQDPGFKELITRRAKIVMRECIGDFLEADLSNTGALEGDEELRIRYSFKKRPPALFMRFRPFLKMKVEGDGAYPPFLPIK